MTTAAWTKGINEPWERKTAIALATFYGVALAICTTLHHLYPSIMRVPPVLPPRVLPHLSYALELAIGDLSCILIAAFALYHGFKKYGPGLTALFFFGSMIFSGLEENEWILLHGRVLGHKSYFFTTGGLWFLEIPFYTCLGWFFITYSSFSLFEVIGARLPRYQRAIAAGLFAMSLDFFADPLLVNIGTTMTPPSPYGLWVWQNEATLRLFSIPLMNFVGWALLVSLFCFLFGTILDRSAAGSLPPRKLLFIFFGSIPVMLLICYSSLSGLEWIFQNYWSHVNIFPMDFPIR